MGADSSSRLGRSTATWLRFYRLAARLTQPTFTLGNVVAVCRGDEVLLVRQRLRTPSQWGLPGGFQKSHESSADGARRELREEVGLDLPVRPDDQVAQYQQPWARHIDTVFAVAPGDPTARPRRQSLEILAVDWFALDDLPVLTREAALALEHVRRSRDGGGSAARGR
jgi:ADP-ribose pyrophosphatase YjhB (NUDIX family)